MFNTTTERALKFIKVEAERVLNIANAQIEYLKDKAEESVNYDDIYSYVTTISNLEKAVKNFKGDIPDEQWLESDIIRYMPDFITSADRVLELCK